MKHHIQHFIRALVAAAVVYAAVYAYRQMTAPPSWPPAPIKVRTIHIEV